MKTINNYIVERIRIDNIKQIPDDVLTKLNDVHNKLIDINRLINKEMGNSPIYFFKLGGRAFFKTNDHNEIEYRVQKGSGEQDIYYSSSFKNFISQYYIDTNIITIRNCDVISWNQTFVPLTVSNFDDENHLYFGIMNNSTDNFDGLCEFIIKKLPYNACFVDNVLGGTQTKYVLFIDLKYLNKYINLVKEYFKNN
jgi:hypothetical protein